VLAPLRRSFRADCVRCWRRAKADTFAAASAFMPILREQPWSRDSFHMEYLDGRDGLWQWNEGLLAFRRGRSVYGHRFVKALAEGSLETLQKGQLVGKGRPLMLRESGSCRTGETRSQLWHGLGGWREWG